MPGQTTTWALRYPLYTEAANVPTQMQNLATDINTGLTTVNNLITLATQRRRAVARRTASVSIPNNAFTTVTFTAESFDNDNMINLGTDATAITVNTSGLYLLIGRNNWAANATGSRAFRFILNGGLVPVTVRDETVAAAATVTNQSFSALVWGNVGDVFRCQVFQNSGAALNSTTTEFGAVRMTG
jgi:hypothetical protein